MLRRFGAGRGPSHGGKRTIFLVERRDFARRPFAERTHAEDAETRPARRRLACATRVPSFSRRVGVAARAFAGVLPFELRAEPRAARRAKTRRLALGDVGARRLGGIV